MDNLKTFSIHKAGGREEVSTISKDGITHQRIQKRRANDVLIIWLDHRIEENSVDYQNEMSEFQHAVNIVKLFKDVDQCVDFLTNIDNKIVFMVVAAALHEHVGLLIINIPQIHSVFIFDPDGTINQQWIEQRSKIQGIFTNLSSILKALKRTVEQCEQNEISISCLSTNTTDMSQMNLNRLDPSFMYTHILKEIVLTIKFEEKHFKEFVKYFHSINADNDHVIESVRKWEKAYYDQSPIWWYTNISFLYPTINSLLRLMKLEILVPMSFFVNDLHQNIQRLYLEQCIHQSFPEIFTLYRGQALSQINLEKIAKNKGGLISFNEFLSTSKNRETAVGFAVSSKDNQKNPEIACVLFIMTINLSQSTTPFASIAEFSRFKDEDEVLFSMHSIFRINSVELLDEEERLYEVHLTLTDDHDHDLRVLTDRIREETFPLESGWYRLGLVLLMMGYIDEAKKVYETLLNETTNESEEARIYHQLAWIKNNQGDYEDALTLYDKALLIYQKSLPLDSFNIINTTNNIGSTLSYMGEYQKALVRYEEALEIQNQVLAPNYSRLATLYNNIGVVYDFINDYPKALSYHQKSLDIKQQSLPPNHPDLSASYNNIGSVYQCQGDYEKALWNHEEALRIQRQSLPSDHYDLSISYNNLATVYNSVSDYEKALLYHERSLKIKEKVMPPNHPSLGNSYYNTGLVQYHLGNYPAALSYQEKSMRIRQQLLPPNHLDLSASYNSMGALHYTMGNNSKALTFFEKALRIREQSLPPNHTDLGASYNNVGLVYFSMGDHRKALFHSEKAMKIRQHSLPPNHLDVSASHYNIGLLYNSMEEYEKALLSHKAALEIRERSLPTNHPDLSASYFNIGLVYCNIENLPQALSFLQKSLEIRENSHSTHHLDLSASYHAIGAVYQKMSYYSKTLFYYNKILDIQQQLVPSNYPDLAGCYYNIGSVCECMEDYQKALFYHEKSLEVKKRSQSLTEPYFSVSYYHIGLAQENMCKYSEALSSYEEAIKVAQQASVPNHPYLQLYQTNLKNLKSKINEMLHN